MQSHKFIKSVPKYSEIAENNDIQHEIIEKRSWVIILYKKTHKLVKEFFKIEI